MKRRGYILVGVMAVIAVIGILVLTVAAQIDRAIHRRRADEGRVQALWLARTAVMAGITGQQTVITSLGGATVRVERKGSNVVAFATLNGGTARVEATMKGDAADFWRERYETKR